MGIAREATQPSQIDIWRAVASETQRLEFKEARNQYDVDKLLQYCVALANEGGGHLLFGISNDPPRVVVGTACFREPVKIEEKLFQRLGFRVDVEEVGHSDGRVLVFHIPSRPRGTAFHSNGAYLMRAGESLVPMSEDHLRKIFSEGKPSWLEEIQVKDLLAEQVSELLYIESYFKLIQLPFTTVSAGVDRLRSDNLIDLVDGRYAIPRATALLLAKDLGSFEDLARKKTRVVVYNGNSKLDTS